MTFEDLAMALVDGGGVKDAFKRELDKAREDADALRRTLSFREACDAVYLEGILARQVGFDADKNPYTGDDLRHGFMARDLWVPWMLGWRSAEAQDAADAIVAAAKSATRDGTVTPACKNGEELREAVARLVGSRK